MRGVAESWVVLKFGGTSVAGAPQWAVIRRLVRARLDDGHRVLVVCSALAGVTNRLQAMAEAGGAAEGITELVDRHRHFADELGIDAADILDDGEGRLERAFGALATKGLAARAEWLFQGEWLSSRLGQRFLDQDPGAGWVDAREALTALPEPDPDSRRAWLGARCASGHGPELAERWAKFAPVLVTPGFVAAAPGGGTALLGRGGSDTSAALLGSRLAAERVEIWTDVPGFYSTDPRLQPGARLLPRLAYDEALEMAAGGARVIHGRSIRAAADANIPLWVRDLSNPDGKGTRIDAVGAAGDAGIRAVILQPGMLVLLLENLDTRQQVGFLAAVFGAISVQGVSVDLVATSETTTTLAINRTTNHLDDAAVDRLAEGLRGLCRVTVYPDCSCVNLVGRGARRALGRMQAIGGFLDQNPLLMASHSANDLCLSLLLDADAAPELAARLHRELIEGPRDKAIRPAAGVA